VLLNRWVELPHLNVAGQPPALWLVVHIDGDVVYLAKPDGTITKNSLVGIRVPLEPAIMDALQRATENATRKANVHQLATGDADISNV